MSESDAHNVTQVLARAAHGDRLATAELLPLVYVELKRMAQSRMGKLPGQTLQPTALVHEAYLRLVDESGAGWDHRGHFFASAARAMRDILVDQARRKGSLKRGGDHQRVDATGAEPLFAEP